MPTHNHAGVVLGIERQVLRVGREGQPLFPDGGLAAIGIALPLDLLPSF